MPDKLISQKQNELKAVKEFKAFVTKLWEAAEYKIALRDCLVELSLREHILSQYLISLHQDVFCDNIPPVKFHPNSVVPTYNYADEINELECQLVSMIDFLEHNNYSDMIAPRFYGRHIQGHIHRLSPQKRL